MFKKILLVLLVLILGMFAFYFFWFLRQPDRVLPDEADSLISPANGTVAAIVPWSRDSLAWEKDAGVVQIITRDVGDRGYLIAIEMNVMNVHYQRAPAAAVLVDENYTPGKFNNALIQTNRYGLRLENERNDMLFMTPDSMYFKVVQVAGLLARRIEDYVVQGQEVERGEVIGLIKMGSQVGLVFPEEMEPSVEVGETVIDGETVLARKRITEFETGN